jgi:hypothetical protein
MAKRKTSSYQGRTQSTEIAKKFTEFDTTKAATDTTFNFITFGTLSGYNTIRKYEPSIKECYK